MKNRFLLLAFILFTSLSLLGCSIKNNNKDDGKDVSMNYTFDSIKFKKSYESLNGKQSKNGSNYRSINIDEDNPFVYITAEELIEKIDNKESFYVYFGSNKCPWCRSVIEQATKWAKEHDVSKVYYVEIWDEDGNEILRDKYTLNSDNKLEKTIDGTEAYYQLLERFDSLLEDYTLKDKNGKTVNVNEKRIFAPNFVYVKDGQALVLVTGISDKQENATSELTSEIVNDEATTFNGFFATYQTCLEELC